MKPRPVKLTRVPLERPPRPGPQSWDVAEPTTVDGEDPEGKTPVVPAPTLWMLAHSGASWYSRYRSLLVGAAAVLLIAATFQIGLRLSTEDPAVRPVAAVVATSASRPTTPPAPQGEPAAAAVPAAPADPPARAPSETVVVSVTVSPANAAIFIDGEPVPSNPFLTRFPRSVASHRVRAVAAGYKTKERLVSFADNVMLDLSLSPSPAEPAARRERSRRREPAARPASRQAAALPPAPAPVVAPAAPSPPPAESVPRPESDKPKRRRIDSSDPYAEDRR